jgi:hypothetical protein
VHPGHKLTAPKEEEEVQYLAFARVCAIGDIKETAILNFIEEKHFLYLQLFCHVYFCYILAI